MCGYFSYGQNNVRTCGLQIKKKPHLPVLAEGAFLLSDTFTDNPADHDRAFPQWKPAVCRYPWKWSPPPDTD